MSLIFGLALLLVLCLTLLIVLSATLGLISRLALLLVLGLALLIILGLTLLLILGLALLGILHLALFLVLRLAFVLIFQFALLLVFGLAFLFILGLTLFLIRSLAFLVLLTVVADGLSYAFLFALGGSILALGGRQATADQKGQADLKIGENLCQNVKNTSRVIKWIIALAHTVQFAGKRRQFGSPNRTSQIWTFALEF